MSQSVTIEEVESLSQVNVDELRDSAERSMKEMRREVEGLSEENINHLMKYFFEPSQLVKWVDSEEKDSALYLAYVNESAVGTLRYKIEEGEAELQALYVDPKYHRNGIASQLIKKAHYDLANLEDFEVEEVRADLFEGNEPSVNLLAGRDNEDQNSQEFEYSREARDEDVFDGVDAIVMKNQL